MFPCARPQKRPPEVRDEPIRGTSRLVVVPAAVTSVAREILVSMLEGGAISTEKAMTMLEGAMTGFDTSLLKGGTSLEGAMLEGTTVASTTVASTTVASTTVASTTVASTMVASELEAFSFISKSSTLLYKT